MFSSIQSRPIVLTPEKEAKVFGLFALALALTLVGVFFGIQFARVLMSSPLQILFLIAELVLIFSSRFWVERSPLNGVLFGLFPLLSGITITPYLLYVLAGYVNGGRILLNALSATVFMAAAASVLALTTRQNLLVWSRALFLGLLGLIFLAVLQIFIPGLQTGAAELLISGLGIVIFALFTAVDIQRVKMLGRYGANPFLLALSLYLDIFNLFLYILRFMLALSGDRR
jgi:FtsH-binding integral membrane protein